MAAYLGDDLNKNRCQAADEDTRKALGCFEDLPEYRWMDIFGVTVKRCAYCTVQKTPEVFTLLKLYRFFKLGHLPQPGGIAAQNPVLIDAFEIIERIEQVKKEKDGG